MVQEYFQKELKRIKLHLANSIFILLSQNSLNSYLGIDFPSSVGQNIDGILIAQSVGATYL